MKACCPHSAANGTSVADFSGCRFSINSRTDSEQALMHNDKPRILIVEDEENTRIALAELLKLDGFDVITACDGEEGYRKALWCNPDLVITDLVMPVSDGLELSSRLRSENGLLHSVPILALSGNLNDYALGARLNSGINRFVRKPLSDYRSLSLTIRSLLLTRRAAVPVV